MRKIYYTIIPIALSIFFIFRFLIPQFSKDSRCITYEEFLSMNLEGVVLKKYIDSTQHSFPIIEIQSLKDITIKKINLNLDTSNFFDRINLHDTLKKEIGSSKVYLIKWNKNELLSNIDFGCADK